MSGGAPLPASQMELQKVHEIQFEFFKDKQIKDYAVCLVDQAKSYEKGRPVRGGINDLRMGTTDFEFACETCHLKHPHCPGHFGYIELAEPMFNIGVYDIVLIVLKCVCKTCGSLLLKEKDEKVMSKLAHLSGINRLRQVSKLCGLKCSMSKSESSADPFMGEADSFGIGQGCGATQPRIGSFGGIYPGLVIKATMEEQDVPWNAEMARQVLDRISDADARIMGFDPERTHPRDLVLTSLPVPPPQVRPAISFGSMKSDDELTHQILSIVKRNQQLVKDKEADVQAAVDRSRALLQEHIATYFNNSSTYYKSTKVTDTKKLKSVTERLKGKYGRLRGNLMGKRVDFSARTVITGDPNIDVDEVGVPFSIAMTLTFPERVNAINKKRLTEFVRRPTYPSANYIFHPNGTISKLALRRDRSTVTLNIGDVVERHVINGDVVLFNRQPTLHRMSMMGHRVRVLNYNTFRLNLSCTTPYNADFDGDEMNLHVPQSLLTKAELMEMMMVPKNFVSPNKSAPCMGIVQDSLLGSYRLTDKETFLDKFFVQSLAMWIDIWELPVPAILKPRPLWTGKQVFSLILPEVNHPATMADKPPFSHDDASVVIRRGQLLCGSIAKSIVGASPGSLIHVIFNEKGSDDVARFINGVQRVATFFNYTFSFSVGVQDTVADADTLHQMNGVLVKARESVEKIGAAANNRTLSRKAGMTLLQSFEADVNGALNKCREEAAKKALSNVRRTNSFKVMIEAGSKGTDLNICQIAVFVGQQNVNGSRIPFGFRRRTLPHFMLDDYGETSRGMANRGYVEGLKPHEFYFHTMAGREGLIDTAVKTSDTGYLQRKLMKALEDVHAAYDGTVRNANQELIQLVYGEDGLDGARIEGGQQLPLPFLDNSKMEDVYKYEYNSDGSFTENVGGTYMDTNVIKMLRADPENVRKLEQEFRQLMDDRDRSRKILEMEEKEKMKLNLPVNVSRLIQNARNTMGKLTQVSNLSPISIIDNVRKLQSDLVQLFPSYNKDFDGRFTDVISQQRVESALTLFKIHVRQLLGSKRVLKEYKLNDKAFEYLLKEIRTKYQQALITPGEIIGAIAAQSCGEPATQMTLNTFHNAGISSKNVTLGVPRLLELLNVSKNQKHASMIVTLVPPWNTKRMTQKAQHMIEFCTLETLTTCIQFIYDPDPMHTVVPEDRAILDMEWTVLDEVDEQERINKIRSGSPWIVRLKLDADLFADKDINMKDVKDAIQLADDTYLIETSMVNEASERTIRLRPKTNVGADSIPTLKKAIPELLARVHLRGVPGVKKALLKDMVAFEVDQSTGNLKNEKTWVIDTDGTALKRIFVGILDEKGNNIVNPTKSSSNKIPEMCSLLGIEAARWKLFTELREAYLAYGLNINYRHYTILVDTMCQRGYLMAVSRTGINRTDMSGPIMRCSFEETVKVLMESASFGEKDPMRGVSANLVLGNQARIGTGLFDLILNIGALQQAVPQEDAIAPGKEVNIYHTLASVQDVASSMPYDARGGTGISSMMATPMANDASVMHRIGGASASSVPHTGSTLYGGTYVASAVHMSQGYPNMYNQGHLSSAALAGRDNSLLSAQNSAQYSVMSSGSVYEPIAGGFSLMQPTSTDYSVASSFNMQSSEAPYTTAVTGKFGSSLHSSPAYSGVKGSNTMLYSPGYSASGAPGGGGRHLFGSGYGPGSTSAMTNSEHDSASYRPDTSPVYVPHAEPMTGGARSGHRPVASHNLSRSMASSGYSAADGGLVEEVASVNTQINQNPSVEYQQHDAHAAAAAGRRGGPEQQSSQSYYQASEFTPEEEEERQL